MLSLKESLYDLLSAAMLSGVNAGGQKGKGPHSMSSHRADGVSPSVLALVSEPSNHTHSKGSDRARTESRAI